MTGLVHAESPLRWEHKIIELYPQQGDKTSRFDFDFINTGTEPVTIDSVKSSCGCTTVALDKKIYQPKEKGRVSAVFTIGRRKGVQVKGISVAVHGEPKPTVLTMVTHIPSR